MENILKLFTDCIDWTLVLIIVLSSFWVKKNFTEILPKTSIAFKIFIWSTVITILYYYFNYLTGVFELKNASCYLVTYFFATSFYELIAKPLLLIIQKIVGSNGTEPADQG